jgi:hypothetical protein
VKMTAEELYSLTMYYFEYKYDGSAEWSDTVFRFMGTNAEWLVTQQKAMKDWRNTLKRDLILIKKLEMEQLPDGSLHYKDLTK